MQLKLIRLGVFGAIAALSIAAHGQILTLTETINGTSGLDNIEYLAISPDGDHVYTGNNSDIEIATYSRSDFNGTLTFASSRILTNFIGSSNAQSILVSPNGLHVYMNAPPEGMTIWNRDLITGALTFNQVLNQSDTADPILMAPSGNFVFFTTNIIFPSPSAEFRAFIRNKGTGTLTSANTAASTTDAILSAAIAPDEEFVYLSTDAPSIDIYDFDPISGNVAFSGAITASPKGSISITQADTIRMSPDGKHLYALSRADTVVVLYARDAVSGGLSFIEEYEFDAAQSALANAKDMAITADGTILFVKGGRTGGDPGIVAYARNKLSGGLSLLGVTQNGVGNLADGSPNQRMIVSPDDNDLYVSEASDGGSIVSYQVGIAPRLFGSIATAGGAEIGCGAIEAVPVFGGVTRTAVVDVHGDYAIESLVPGTYNIRAIAFGFQEITITNVNIIADIERNFGLAPASANGTVSGQVTDADTGDPLVGVLVRAFVGPSLVDTTYTCIDGRYEVSGFFTKGGTVEVRLEFDLPNYNDEQQTVDADPVQGVVSNQTMSKSVTGAATITGTVATGNAGTPLGSAQVKLQGAINASTNSNGVGAYSFDAVLGGAYTIEVSAPGHVTQSIGVAVPDSTVFFAPPVVLAVDGSCVPPAPTGVSATDGAFDDRVRVTWNGAAGATSYQIFRNTSNSSAGSILIGTSNSTTFDDLTAKFATNTPNTNPSPWAFAIVAPIGLLALSNKRRRHALAIAVVLVCVALFSAGCPPSGGGGQNGQTFVYFVKSVNVCGASNFSAGDSGFRTN